MVAADDSYAKAEVAVDAARPAAAAVTVAQLQDARRSLEDAGEAAVHLQQYVSSFHEVPWIGPLFLANAAASAAAIAGLAYPGTRQLASLAGVVISAVASAASS